MLRYQVQPVAERRPLFPDGADRNFRADWWTRSLPGQEWGSYYDGRSEVARLGVDPAFLSHRKSGQGALYIVWFEVSHALRFDTGTSLSRGIGTSIIEDLKSSIDGEIYLSSTDDARRWWQRLGWRDCQCARCHGSEPLLVTAGLA